MANAKRTCIEADYEPLMRDGVEEVSICKVADQIDCSSTELTRRFSHIGRLVPGV